MRADHFAEVWLSSSFYSHHQHQHHHYVQVRELSREGVSGRGTSGIVTSSTKLTFRSRSSHIVLLVQMSREMWQFDNNGEMAFEKVGQPPVG